MPEEQQRETFTLPVQLHIPEGLTSQYVTNISIQDSGAEFYIYLFRADPPILFGTPEEQEATLRKSPPIQAECVGRFIVSKERMQELVMVFAQAWQQALLQREKKEQA